MRILVTGCLGFIGSHCVKALRENYDVIGLDIGNDTKSYNRVKDDMLRIVFRDLSKTASGVLEGIDIVIHFAAETFVDHSIKDPSCFIQSNILGTFNLLEEARRYPVKKFIHISTDEVYGNSQDGYFTEESPLNPGNPYSATKASADMLALAYRNTYGIPITILRPENNYGTFQHTQKAIPTFIKKILANDPVPIYGDGKHKRMWLHVQDFCSAVKWVIHTDHKHVIYNVGSKQEWENIEVLKMIASILNLPYEVKYIPDEIARPGHDRRYAIHTEKILGTSWHPKHTFENSLPTVVKWYEQNQWWFK